MVAGALCDILNMNILNIIGRDKALFLDDLLTHNKSLCQEIMKSKFLVLGAAGSIGQAVTKEIFKRNPKVLHAVDISENNLTELVRDIRSNYGYIDGEFKTFSLDIGSSIYESFFQKQNDYDYILNLTALKHVRSEKDPYTLMRMVETNIFNTYKSLKLGADKNMKKYFCVSTDKAASPVNLMGASKQIMEMLLSLESQNSCISTARFANVAFSDGSLLHSFQQRIYKHQPIVAPNDVKRYFVTSEESGLLCLFSCLQGENRDIFFPKLCPSEHLESFQDIATRFLNELGFTPHECVDEDEARCTVNELINQKKWPCLWTKSDTSGEKTIEEFYTPNEKVNLNRFNEIGVISMTSQEKNFDFDDFRLQILDLIHQNDWKRQDIIEIFKNVLPTFNHIDTGKFLDGKM